MTARIATYEDLIAVPENMVAELIDGELYASPRSPGRHIRARSALGGLIGPPFDFGKGGPGGWWILLQPELHFGRNVLVPDLAGWRKERMPQIPEGHFSVVPDWVCEVIFPATERLDRLKKMPVYARERIPFAWIVDPLQHLLSARRLHEGTWILREYGEDKLRVEPFDAIEMDMSHVWG